MSSNIVTFRNKTNRDLSVFHDGKSLVVGPHADFTTSEEVAGKFFLTHPASVERVDVAGMGTAAGPTQVAKKTWIANLTGNPDAPDTVYDEYYDKVEKRFKTRQVPNKFKRAEPLELVMTGAETIVAGVGGLATTTKAPPSYVRIAPYTVAEVPAAFANYLDRRARQGAIGDAQFGQYVNLSLSRALPEWRPDITWSIEDLRLYLLMCKSYTKEQMAGWEKSTAAIRNFIKKEDMADIEVQRVKIEIYKRIFFCLVDQKVRLPLKEEFEAARESSKKPSTIVATTGAKSDNDAVLAALSGVA